MVQIKFLLLPALLGVTSALAIAPNALGSHQRQISQVERRDSKLISDNLPPPPANPGRTTGGGRRDGSLCPQDAKTATQPLIALSATMEPGVTLADRPTFFVSVPETRAQTVEFSLFDQNKRGIYQTTFALTDAPGIVSFTLPSNAPPLAVGKTYTWFFTLICDPKNRRRDRPTTGEIRRIQLNSSQLRQIERATPKERVSLYKQAGVWYETIFTMIELQRSQPTDSALKTTWQAVLQSGGLDPTTIQPLRN